MEGDGSKVSCEGDDAFWRFTVLMAKQLFTHTLSCMVKEAISQYGKYIQQSPVHPRTN